MTITHQESDHTGDHTIEDHFHGGDQKSSTKTGNPTAVAFAIVFAVLFTGLSIYVIYGKLARRKARLKKDEKDVPSFGASLFQATANKYENRYPGTSLLVPRRMIKIKSSV